MLKTIDEYKIVAWRKAPSSGSRGGRGLARAHAARARMCVLLPLAYILSTVLTYRVFKKQVGFLKVLQIGARWTKMLKLFFSDFQKTQYF